MNLAHVETPLGMREWLDAQLNAARRWLALGAALGAIGTWASIPVLTASAKLPAIDIWLHICSGLVLAGSVVWLLLSRGSVRKFSIVLLMVEALLITMRMSVGFLTADPSQGVSEVLPPLSPWVPLIFVVAFLLFSLREALYFSCAHMLVLNMAVLVFVTQAPALVGNSYDMLNVTLQYLFMHPLLVLLLYLIFRIQNQQRQALEEAYAREASLARKLEQDDRQDGLSRAGILNMLTKTLEKLAQGRSAVLIECHLKTYKSVVESAGADGVEVAVQNLMTGIREAIDSELNIGRLDSDRILLIIHVKKDTTIGLDNIQERLMEVANRVEPLLGASFFAIDLSSGMTSGIALKTLELMVLKSRA